MNWLFSFSGLAIISIVLEWILLTIIDCANCNTSTHKKLQLACKGILICCIIFYVALIATCGIVSFHYYRNGDIETAIKLALTAFIVIVCVYYLFLRTPIKKLFHSKHNSR